MNEYRTPTNVEIALYALEQLGGATKTVCSEDIAARCYELAPARFGWRLEKYRKKRWPDKYIAKTALDDAKKDRWGVLVDGAYNLDLPKDGWNLTAAGVAWLNENRPRIGESLDTKPAQLPKNEAERFVKRITRQGIFKRFKVAGSLDDSSVFEFTDLLECAPDASRDVVRSKFRRLKATAELIQDHEILRFLEACEKQFRRLSDEPTRTGDDQ